METLKLSSVIDKVKQYPVPDTDDIVEAASLIAYYNFPTEIVLPMINVTTMALMMDRMVVHDLSPGTIRVVREISIQDLPEEPPAFLRLPWLIETKDNVPLFGETFCLGGYYINNKYFLIGFLANDGVRVEPWEPEWGKDLKIPIEHSLLVDDKLEEGRQEWINEAARFSLGLGILLEAAKTPLTVKKAGKAHRKTKGGKKNKGEWATRRVILGRMATRYYGQSPAGVKLDKDGKVLSRTMVSGHLRYQPYGPNREKRKWIWIDTYESRRWTSAKTKIEVNEE